jgi:CDP-diacylglycerol--glycerol-3-phosphate 3-phosphatidyltransferase
MKQSATIWNVPNRLSVARLVLSILVFIFLPLGLYWPALIGFVIAAGTDWIDGWWARKYDQVTQLGRILDPFCDKFLVCGTFILLAVEMRDYPWYSSVAGWMAVIIVARELLVTALRSFIENAGGDFSARMAGKLKMWFQCIAVVACLLALATAGRDPSAADAPAIPLWLNATAAVSVWLAVLSTLVSGYEYVVIAVKTIDLGAR